MAKQQSLQQLANKIQRTLPSISVAVANSEVVGTSTALGDITRRIFNEGKRTDGANIGNYTSPPYIARRKNKSLQVNYIDLQFSGDLFNSIKQGRFNDNPAVGIVSEKENDVADHLEKRFGMIFTASEEEKKIAAETAKDYFFTELKKIIKTWS